MKKIQFLLLNTILISSLFGQNETSQQPAPTIEPDLYQKNKARIFTSAEFLWWTIQEDAMDYALRMTHANAGGTNFFPQGKYKVGKFDWDPGFRLTLGYFNAPKYWEVYGQYSWICVSGMNSVDKPSDPTRFLNETLDSLMNNDLTRATSKIGFYYNLADLFVDRVFIPNPHFRMRILGGITGTLINQNWRVRYISMLDEIERIRHKWRYTGIGFRIGMATDWFWGSNFYLTGRWTTAILIGSYRNWYSQKVLTNPSNFRDTSYQDYRPAVTSQFSLGISYQKNFNGRRLEIFAGYEFTPWFNLQENYRAIDLAIQPPRIITHNRSLILMQGLTARLQFDF